ncbi:protein PSY3-like [Aristolochia californica]|uniref:protein PSY3-like n=1 Tax=Aristolochia californica TaxID=171875 RepID=UPI0035DE09BA
MALPRNSVVALCCCLFFAMALVSSARNTVTITGVETGPTGRSLLASLNDYSDPSANKGHEPHEPKANSGGGGGGGGRRNP